MRPTFGITPLVIVVGVLVIAYLIGVLRRRADIRKAQSLAPGAFIFRFSMSGDFGTKLPFLPPSMLVGQRIGIDRVAAVSATDRGMAIWQVGPGVQLADLPWAAITGVHATATVVRVGLSSIAYPTVIVDSRNSYGSPLSLPFLSANSRYARPRTSMAEVDRIVAKLERLRLQRI